MIQTSMLPLSWRTSHFRKIGCRIRTFTAGKTDFPNGSADK